MTEEIVSQEYDWDTHEKIVSDLDLLAAYHDKIAKGDFDDMAMNSRLMFSDIFPGDSVRQVTATVRDVIAHREKWVDAFFWALPVFQAQSRKMIDDTVKHFAAVVTDFPETDKTDKIIAYGEATRERAYNIIRGFEVLRPVMKGQSKALFNFEEIKAQVTVVIDKFMMGARRTERPSDPRPMQSRCATLAQAENTLSEKFFRYASLEHALLDRTMTVVAAKTLLQKAEAKNSAAVLPDVSGIARHFLTATRADLDFARGLRRAAYQTGQFNAPHFIGH